MRAAVHIMCELSSTETPLRRGLSTAHVHAAALSAADSHAESKGELPQPESKQRTIGSMSQSQLQAEKVCSESAVAVTPAQPMVPCLQSHLKKRLRQYDTAFEAKYGRKVSSVTRKKPLSLFHHLFLQPEKSDKEPIRHLYQRYHDLKKAIETGPGANISGADSDAGSTVSAVTGASHASSASAADLVSPSTMKGLRKEKRRLQIRLREYEDKFMMDNGRKVKYHRDIAPVAAEYRRYKEIKNTLKIVR